MNQNHESVDGATSNYNLSFPGVLMVCFFAWNIIHACI